MRLINTETLELEEFLQPIPPYAILSHTWEGQEVTLQEWNSVPREHLLSVLAHLEGLNPADALIREWLDSQPDSWHNRSALDPSGRLEKVGYWKILEACIEAREDGLWYLWVDTNCIDKTSSAELSEAINSMYIWYRSAAVCYAYLVDVPDPDPADNSPSEAIEKSPTDLLRGSALEAFRRSRWFSRGWTLQELLAPKKVRFYSRYWRYLGNKKKLASLLAEITRIDKKYLSYAVDIRSASVAQRMAAVANRTTTRPEDIAYCLLGLFNVNMPLLYGEGTKAFVRLQEEIIKASDDHSIFAWAWMEELKGRQFLQAVVARQGRLSYDFKPNCPTHRLQHLLQDRIKREVARPTILALDPVCFFDASAVPIMKPTSSPGVFTVTNLGLSLALPGFIQPCRRLAFGIIHNEFNSVDGTTMVIMIPLVRHYKHLDHWTRTSFPTAPVTVVFRGLVDPIDLLVELSTIKVCRDVQHASFYFDAFGGTSHRFGFWLLFPQTRIYRVAAHRLNMRFNLVHGSVLGDGMYNDHGIFFDPNPQDQRQVLGGLLVFHTEVVAEQRRRRQKNPFLLLFLALEVRKKANGEFEKTYAGSRVFIHRKAPDDVLYLLKKFAAHTGDHLDDVSLSKFECDDPAKTAFKRRLKLSRASVTHLNDEALSHSPHSEITLTEVKLLYSE
ncbi:heterokaryon incompatibility protein-domain-containing protein [Astrocystis sublimbata]|nr:heterokaryon incompatibility protein-domain-containing protein [Astrocystis sublimbata]